ncbi:MAG: hypothetical protein Q7Q71_07925 [Verrucomicrobiota bacterium JB023]|nr:hypothetical protein [Verrucomicrobiota bacterium JB023]
MRMLTASLVAVTVQTALAVPEITFINEKIYRATGEDGFELRDGNLQFILHDGYFVRECAFHLDPQDEIFNFPFPAGFILECPAGDNALVTSRFGDSTGDIATVWTRVSTVNEATSVPPNFPSMIELTAAPVTDLPRPIRDFRDRSTLVLHDLQTASFSEKDVTIYEMNRAYDPGDPDVNADGVISAEERASFTERSEDADLRQTRETMILYGNSNGYLLSYPSKIWVDANVGRDPSNAPRLESAVNQLTMIEAWPGQSVRAGLTRVEQGFRFTELDQFGTDFDGDPALLIDPRDPPRISWEGNDPSNTLSSIDGMYVRIFERRYNDDGIPIPNSTDTEAFDITAITPALVGEDAEDSVGVIIETVMNEATQETIAEALEEGLFTADDFVDLYVADNEQIRLYNTGYEELDGMSFYARVLEGPVVDAINNTITFTQTIELFTDDGLITPTDFETLTGTPTGEGVLISEEADFEYPIWPYSFVEDNFGGQLVLPSVYEQGYQIPFIALTLNLADSSPTRVDLLPDPKPRNDLIFRVRFERNVQSADSSGNQFLVNGDNSLRDFELEMCICDTFDGAINGALTNKSVKGKTNKDAQFSPDADYDGDGKTNFFEFAFDSSGSITETKAAMFDSKNTVDAEFDVSIDPDTKQCILKLAKRPGVRETILYGFEQIDPTTGEKTRIDADSEGWEVVTNDAFTMELRSEASVSGSALFCAVAEQNTFELVTEAGSESE